MSSDQIHVDLVADYNIYRHMIKAIANLANIYANCAILQVPLS